MDILPLFDMQLESSNRQAEAWLCGACKLGLDGL